MGYELHVTIGDHWDDEEIDEDVWQALVAADPELELAGSVGTETPSGDVISYGNELMAMWHGHPSGPVALDFRRGKVIAKNPDDAIIKKLQSIAAQLGAVVQGDEGELYE